MQYVRPVPISATSRVQSITPMPQARRMISFRPMSQSPPPFESVRQQARLGPFEDVFVPHTPSSGGPASLPLLARGIALLSITQLREILREYSLPTGGNKQVLVSRLMIFLDTFGQNQPNLISEFSSRLKTILSSTNHDTASSAPSTPEEVPPVDTAPMESVRDVLNVSPSCLFRPVPGAPLPVGPIQIPAPIGFRTSFAIPSAPGEGMVPILQFVPSVTDVMVRRLTLQVGGVVSSLRDNTLWCDLTDSTKRQTNVTLLQMDPCIPLVMIVRWMARVPLLELAQKIVMERESAPEIGRRATMTPVGLCPLTKKLIARPARGVKCLHADCFDLTGFLSYALKHNSWICPICHNMLTAEDLRVDSNYFQLR